jgi:hypothetical protein
MAITPASFNLGNVIVNTSFQQSVTIANPGTSAVTLTGPSTPFAWDQGAAPVTLNAGASLAVAVTYTPTTTGAATGGTIASSDGSQCSLTGTVVVVSFSSASLAFGNVAVGSSSPESVTITNPGQVAVSIPGPSAPFSMSPSPAAVPASGSTTVNVTFSPTTPGSASGTLSGSGGTCALSGTGATVSFSSASLAFGSVTVGTQSSSQSVTITNPGQVPISIPGPGAPFSMSPSPATVPGNGSTAVTVTFDPTFVGAASGTVGTCALSGVGLSGPDAFESDSDPTQSSSAPGGDAATAGVKYYQISVPNFTAVSAPPGVPAPTSYVGTNGKSSAGTVPTFTGASSFLRLGSSPLTSEWSSAAFQNSVNLARLVGDPLAIAKSEGMTASATLTGNVDNPAGSTLAYKRPDADTFYNTDQPTTGGTLPSGAPALSGTFSDDFVDGNPPTEGTPWDGTAFGSAQDPNFLLGFADDTRWRGAPEDAANIVGDTTNNLSTNNNVLSPPTTLLNNQPVPNVNANRMTETLNLLTKGGWWDHSDGNRVSTTMGDKIEVVQGNYKLVVLGRQPAPVAPPLSNTVDLQQCLTDCPTLLDALETWYNAQADGGTGDLTPVQAILTAGYPTSTPAAADVSAKFKYQVQVWIATQNTFITDVSGGHFQEQYPSPTPCIKTIEYSQDNNNEWTLYQDNTQGNLITRYKGRTVDLFQGASRETYVGSADKTILWTTDQAPTAPSPAPSTANALRLDPMIASYTWAQSVYSQTGSESKPIGPVGAGASKYGTPATATGNNPTTQPTTTGPQPTAVNSSISVGNGDVVSATWANRVASYVGSTTTSVPTVYSETHAGSVTSNTYAGSVTSNTYASGTVTSYTSADTIESTSVVGSTTIYSHIDNNALGNIVNATKAGSMTNLNAAFNFIDLSIGIKTSIAVANMRDIYIGTKTSVTLLDLTEMFAGMKYSIQAGAAYTFNTASETKVTSSSAQIAAILMLGI